MKYKKISNEVKRRIFELRETGLSTYKIAEELVLSQSNVCYYLGNREERINKVKERYQALPKEEKRRRFEKNYPYLKNYLRERYKNDPIFRAKQIERAKNYKKMKGGKKIK